MNKCKKTKGKENYSLAEIFEAIESCFNDFFGEGINDYEQWKNTDIEYYIEKFADRNKWLYQDAVDWLEELEEVNPALALSVILKEIAIELDKKYNDHIENSNAVYFISLFDGRIYRATKEQIKNYKYFATFRTKEDAKFAYGIVKDSFKEMFEADAKK